MTCCRSFFLFVFSSCLLSHVPAHRPYAPVYSSSSSCWFCPSNSSYLLRAGLSVQQHLSFSCWFVRGTGVCSASSRTLFSLQRSSAKLFFTVRTRGSFIGKFHSFHGSFHRFQIRFIHLHGSAWTLPQRLRKLPWKQCKGP